MANFVFPRRKEYFTTISDDTSHKSFAESSFRKYQNLRLYGTCEWLLGEPGYQAWAACKGSHIRISGKGKTILVNDGRPTINGQKNSGMWQINIGVSFDSGLICREVALMQGLFSNAARERSSTFRREKQKIRVTGCSTSSRARTSAKAA